MNWNDVIGQDDVKRRLVSMVHNNRLPHALMLCGPSGSGKLALGLALASYLLCERHAEGDAPCGECAALNTPTCTSLSPLFAPQERRANTR